MARRRIDSSYAYAEKTDASTARRSARLGEAAAARVRKARRMRRKERLFVPMPPVVVVVVVAERESAPAGAAVGEGEVVAACEKDEGVEVEARRAVKAV